MTLQIVLEDSCVKLLTRLCSVDLVTLEMFCLNGIYPSSDLRLFRTVFLLEIADFERFSRPHGRFHHARLCIFPTRQRCFIRERQRIQLARDCFHRISFSHRLGSHSSCDSLPLHSEVASEIKDHVHHHQTRSHYVHRHRSFNNLRQRSYRYKKLQRE